METSQNAGRFAIGGNACSLVGVGTKPAGSGGWKVPPAKDFAVIEVTSGNVRVAKFSQVPADADDTAATVPNRTAEHDSNFNGRIMISLPVTHFHSSALCATLLLYRHHWPVRRPWSIS
jgi:hypothetical protein